MKLLILISLLGFILLRKTGTGTLTESKIINLVKDFKEDIDSKGLDCMKLCLKLAEIQYLKYYVLVILKKETPFVKFMTKIRQARLKKCKGLESFYKSKQYVKGEHLTCINQIDQDCSFSDGTLFSPMQNGICYLKSKKKLKAEEKEKEMQIQLATLESGYISDDEEDDFPKHGD
jgi:hypothetical protein